MVYKTVFPNFLLVRNEAPQAKVTALATFRSQGLLMSRSVILPASVSLENILETELDNARADGGTGDLSERQVIPHSIGIGELGSIKGIVKLRPELEGVPFFYSRVLDNRNIEVRLAGTANNASTGIAPSGSIAINSTGWQCTECALVDVAWAAACPTQPIINVAGGWDGAIGCFRTHLRPGSAGTINTVGRIFSECQGKTGLDCGDSGNAPSIEEFSLGSRMRPERQIILIVQNEAMRPVPAGRPVLLIQIQWVIGIRAVPRTKRSEVFTESVRCLQRQSMGKRFAHRGLKAMVVGIAIEICPPKAGRLIPDMGHAQAPIGERIGGLAVYWICRGRQSSKIYILVRIHEFRSVR
jgi:hypothetical protein